MSIYIFDCIGQCNTSKESIVSLRKYVAKSIARGPDDRLLRMRTKIADVFFGGLSGGDSTYFSQYILT